MGAIFVTETAARRRGVDKYHADSHLVLQHGHVNLKIPVKTPVNLQVPYL